MFPWIDCLKIMMVSNSFLILAVFKQILWKTMDFGNAVCLGTSITDNLLLLLYSKSFGHFRLWTDFQQVSLAASFLTQKNGSLGYLLQVKKNRLKRKNKSEITWKIAMQLKNNYRSSDLNSHLNLGQIISEKTQENLEISNLHLEELT